MTEPSPPQAPTAVSSDAADDTKKPARERILDAAIEEFSAFGFAGARIDRIASAAGINKQLIYHYFGGKSDLYREVLHRVVSLTRTLRRESTTDNSKYLERMLSVLRSSRTPVGQAWVRLLMFEALETDLAHYAQSEGRASERGKAYENNVEAVLAAQETGEIDSELDPRLVPMMMLGLSVMPLLMPQWVGLAKGANPTDSSFLDEWEHLLVQMYGRLRAPTKK